MTTHWLSGRGYWIATVILSIVLLLGAFMVVAIAITQNDRSSAVAVPGATPTPSESPSPNASGRMLIPIPADADCSACHLVDGQVTTKNIPLMAHPIEGWTDCTACHANDSLVKTAPGHSGIHKDECLACHKPPGPGASALPRPHHIVAGTACVTCHGSKAPLPTDMAGRNNCWICHPAADTAALFGSPAATASPGPTVPAGTGGSGTDGSLAPPSPDISPTR